ncbi:adenylosuccinate lyase, partial [Streptomyces sp. SID8455]|nr:adenylosuccinate lyase [Streptomyces sp. SID8455]
MFVDTLSVMDEELRSLMDRSRDEAAGSAAYDLLAATDDNEVLARVLVEPGRPLWA